MLRDLFVQSRQRYDEVTTKRRRRTVPADDARAAMSKKSFDWSGRMATGTQKLFFLNVAFALQCPADLQWAGHLRNDTRMLSTDDRRGKHTLPDSVAII